MSIPQVRPVHGGSPLPKAKYPRFAFWDVEGAKAEVQDLRMRLAHRIRRHRKDIKWLDALPVQVQRELRALAHELSTRRLSQQDIQRSSIRTIKFLTGEAIASSLCQDKTTLSAVGHTGNGNSLSESTD